jgi:hypothetical protein
MSHLSLVREFWDFLKHRKKFWLLPLVLMLLALGLLIVLTANSAVAPFIYTLF